MSVSTNAIFGRIFDSALEKAQEISLDKAYIIKCDAIKEKSVNNKNSILDLIDILKVGSLIYQLKGSSFEVQSKGNIHYFQYFDFNFEDAGESFQLARLVVKPIKLSILLEQQGSLKLLGYEGGLEICPGRNFILKTSKYYNGSRELLSIKDTKGYISEIKTSDIKEFLS